MTALAEVIRSMPAPRTGPEKDAWLAILAAYWRQSKFNVEWVWTA